MAQNSDSATLKGWDACFTTVPPIIIIRHSCRVFLFTISSNFHVWFRHFNLLNFVAPQVFIFLGIDFVYFDIRAVDRFRLLSQSESSQQRLPVFLARLVLQSSIRPPERSAKDINLSLILAPPSRNPAHLDIVPFTYLRLRFSSTRPLFQRTCSRRRARPLSHLSQGGRESSCARSASSCTRPKPTFVSL